MGMVRVRRIHLNSVEGKGKWVRLKNWSPLGKKEDGGGLGIGRTGGRENAVFC